MRRRSSVAVLTAAMVTMLAGCATTTTTGMGGGDMSVKGQQDKPVMFSWKSNDGGISGTMVATLPAATFTGPFVQVTHETRSESLAPLWVGWTTGWSDWAYWSRPWNGPYSFNRFERYYSGKVVANLRDAGGATMRCRFNLDDPSGGMSGGGQGECQLSGGRIVDAIINRT